MASSPQRFDRSITEGPILRAVWKLAWPTMLQNSIAGLQGIIDHTMVGHYVGFTGNAAIGVSWQIFLVVIVFVSSLYTGMAVLVARFAGAHDSEKVNRVVYQAFLTSVILAAGILAPLGYFFAPRLLEMVNATEAVRAEALPYLRIMFLFSIGMLMYFMLGGALRAAGDARTPLYLGLFITVLNAALNVILIRGFGPIPAFGTRGAAIGTVIATGVAAIIGLFLLFSHRLPVRFSRSMSWWPDWEVVHSLFRFGLPAGFQGIVMNIGGVLMLRFIGSLQHSAEAQAAFTVCYSELFALITWTANGLMGAAAVVAGQNLGAARPDRTIHGVHLASRMGLGIAATIGAVFLIFPRALLGIFGLDDPVVVQLGRQLLAYLSVSGLFIAVALSYTGGLQGTGDTRSPFYISLLSQVAVPLGYCAMVQAWRGLMPADVWLAIVLGHFTRCSLSVVRFRQEQWRRITVSLDGRTPNAEVA
ncbi:MAG TPA: MATE family efflux transporter [Vicinamibacterales bacterium]